jgi:hypothetical protein
MHFPALQPTVVCVRKVAVEAQLIVLTVLQRYYAVSNQADSALQTIPAVHAVLYVTTVQRQGQQVAHVPTVAILTRTADLAALHSGLAGLTARVLHKLTLLFLRDYLPVTVLLSHTVSKTTATILSGTDLDITSLSSS